MEAWIADSGNMEGPHVLEAIFPQYPSLEHME